MIVVPNVTYTDDETVRQLQAAAARGTAIGVIGPNCMKWDPVGQERHLPNITGAKTVQLGTPQSYQLPMDRWIHAAQVPREIVALDEHDNPVWGVELRTVRLDEQRLVYLINLLAGRQRFVVYPCP